MAPFKAFLVRLDRNLFNNKVHFNFLKMEPLTIFQYCNNKLFLY